MYIKYTINFSKSNQVVTTNIYIQLNKVTYTSLISQLMVHCTEKIYTKNHIDIINQFDNVSN